MVGRLLPSFKKVTHSTCRCSQTYQSKSSSELNIVSFLHSKPLKMLYIQVRNSESKIISRVDLDILWLNQPLKPEKYLLPISLAR